MFELLLTCRVQLFWRGNVSSVLGLGDAIAGRQCGGGDATSVLAVPRSSLLPLTLSINNMSQMAHKHDEERTARSV